jgi:predicted transcriptional regulator
VALVTDFVELRKDRIGVHGVVNCTYTVFDRDGQRYLQLDTYGSTDRQIPDKVSQSIQLDKSSAASLKGLIERTFRI